MLEVAIRLDMVACGRNCHFSRPRTLYIPVGCCACYSPCAGRPAARLPNFRLAVAIWAMLLGVSSAGALTKKKTALGIRGTCRDAVPRIFIFWSLAGDSGQMMQYSTYRRRAEDGQLSRPLMVRPSQNPWFWKWGNDSYRCYVHTYIQVCRYMYIYI